jgi:TIR domain
MAHKAVVGSMSKIFLSYRRQDSAGVAGRISDRLRAHFGEDSLFMDIDSIPFGEDFREHIDSAVAQCKLVLALIGSKWAGDADGRRRIDDPRDIVRIEIESALKRGIPVIPILIDRAKMPSEAELPPSLAGLAFRHAADVDQGRDFHPHAAATSAAGTGDVERAYAILKQSITTLVHDDVPGLLWYNLGCYATNLQKNDEAMCYLKRAFDNGFADINKYLSDRDLIPLRQREDFCMLVGRANADGDGAQR